MRRLGMPVSDTTILAGLRKHARSRSESSAVAAVHVAGVDDWAWRKGSNYGTIIVDLERREVVDVLVDRSAVPVIRITFQQYPNELALIRFIRERSVEILKKMGVEKTWTGPTLTGVGSSHDLGGLRMGTDETSSVVNADCMTHEVPNLYIMSGAVFPSVPGVKPTLTIQAVVWRAADRLAADWRRGRGL